MKKVIAGLSAGLIIGGGAMLAVPSHAAGSDGAPQCHLKAFDAWSALLRIQGQSSSHHPARALRHDARLARHTLRAADCI